MPLLSSSKEEQEGLTYFEVKDVGLVFHEPVVKVMTESKMTTQQFADFEKVTMKWFKTSSQLKKSTESLRFI